MLKSVLIIAVIAIVTVLLRVLPFLIFNGKKTTPAYITYLGNVLPEAVIGMLVIYCYKTTSFAEISGYLPALIAGIAVVVMHVWKRNTLLSILGGTVLYMVLVHFI